MANRTSRTKSVSREISGLLPQSLLRYVRAALGEAAAEEVAASAGAGLTLEELSQQGRWFSAEEVRALAAAATKLCGDTEIGRRAGEQMFLDSCRLGMTDFVSAAGSLEAAFPLMVRYATRMSVGATYTIISSGPREAVMQCDYKAVTADHRFFCEFTAGYYSSVPSLFGDVGRVTEPQCQARGDKACRFHITWSRDPRPRAGVPDAGQVAESARRSELMLGRFEQLQTMASELVRADDVDEVLERITERAGIAVQAPRYLLVARTDESDPLRVHHFGFGDQAEAYDCAARLMFSELGDNDGALVAPIESARRQYGFLAALYAPSAEFSRIDRRLLDAYAGHAAAALEVVASLETARRDRDSARAILELARDLAVVGTADEITERLSSAVLGVTGADISSIWLWDESAERLTLATGHDGDTQLPKQPVHMSFDALPALAEMVRQPRATLLQVGNAPEALRPMFAAYGAVTTVIVPIVFRSRFMGLVAAAYRHELAAGPEATDILDRLNGVAHHAATALENAELLEQTRHQALHDALTGLPNRPLVQDRAAVALRKARRTGERIGLLFVDLDRFKNVNDTLGHGAGDELIRAVGQRLAGVVRGSDTLARLGGDEFTVLLPGITGIDEAQAVAGRLIDVLGEPFEVNGHELFISCSIGIACSPDHGADYESLMQNADAAMYEAKALGRSTYAVHSEVPSTERRQLLELESNLHKAVENDELRVHYQPQVDLQTGKVVAVEALVRWQHAELGLLPPAAFLPVAEESGLIVNIDKWVRDQAFAQGRKWADAGTPVRVAVNLSTRDLANPRLAELLTAELADAGLAPELVEIEVTDRVVMSDETLPSIIEALSALGMSIAIDDFGTGNSVLGRLQRCRVDTLKIDRSFVNEMAPDSPEAPVVKALIALAHSLELDVIAEGVETEDQRAMLSHYGCDVGQGYLFSRPVDAAVIDELLAAQAAGLVEAAC